MTDPTDPMASADAAAARLDDAVARARSASAAADRLAGQTRSLTATATSPQRDVTVTAAPGGRIASVTFGPEALGLTGTELGRIVTATIGEAQNRVARAVVDLAADEFGGESALTERLRADAEAAFPPPGRDGLIR